MARRLVALMIGMLGVVITLWVPAEEYKVATAISFFVLTLGLLALEELADRGARKAAEVDRQRFSHELLVIRQQVTIQARQEMSRNASLKNRARFVAAEVNEFLAEMRDAALPHRPAKRRPDGGLDYDDWNAKTNEMLRQSAAWDLRYAKELKPQVLQIIEELARTGVVHDLSRLRALASGNMAGAGIVADEILIAAGKLL